MGVYIKGMEKPEGCAFCKIKRRNGKKMLCPLCGEEWDIHDPMSADHTLDTCPLAPVQPHGRLIDADALIESLRIGDLPIRLTCEIRNAPTIIPAEEGE